MMMKMKRLPNVLRDDAIEQHLNGLLSQSEDIKHLCQYNSLDDEQVESSMEPNTWTGASC